MKSTILALFLFVAYLAPSIESGNVIGYVSENVVGQGMVVNRFQQPSGEPTKLSELMPDAPLGTELAFFDGAEWVTAVADEGDDGMIHWFDKRDDHIADAYEVPIGAGVKYKLPEGTRGSFMFNGEVRESYMNDAAAVFDGGISLAEVRLPRDRASEILKPQIVATNNVVVTNLPPNRFAVRLKSGELIHAAWMAGSLTICDPVSGLELKIPISSITRFEVDDVAPQKMRMDKTTVAKVEQFYLAEVKKERKRQEAARQENTEKGIVKSIKDYLFATILRPQSLLYALLGMLVSAVISYYVGKVLDKFHKRENSLNKNMVGTAASEEFETANNTDKTGSRTQNTKQKVAKPKGKQNRKKNKMRR